MSTRAFRCPARAAAATLLVALATACERPLTLEPKDGPDTDRSVHAGTARDQLLREVRAATARFHAPAQATAAGFAETHHCVPQMGYHRVSSARVDGVFEPTEPEVVLYATGPGGEPRLVAVEYIVMDTGQARPSFGGHPFDVGGAPIPASHWTLHVWLYEANPLGIFVARNPAISCP